MTYKTILPDGHTEHLTREQLQDDYNVRFCSTCGKPMDKGFVIGDGWRYHCNENCFTDAYPYTQYLAEYTDEGDSYYTEWYDYQVFEEDGEITIYIKAL